MKHIKLLIIILTISASSVIAQEEKKVAVFDPVANVDNAIIEIVREEISSAIVNSEGYIALERRLINKVLEENKFQGSGLVGEEQVSEIGKIMGADFVLVTTISTISTNYYISCKLVEVATALIEMQATGVTKQGTNDLTTTTQTIVNSMLASKALPNRAIAKTDTVTTKSKTENKAEPKSATATVTENSVFTTQGGAVYCDGIKMEKSQLLSLLNSSPGSRERYLGGISKRSTGTGLIAAGVALPVVGGGIGFLVTSEKTERDGNNIVQRTYYNWKTYALIGAVAGAGVIAFGIHLKSAGSKEVRGAIDTFSYGRKKSQSDPSLKLELKTDGIGLSYNF